MYTVEEVHLVYNYVAIWYAMVDISREVAIYYIINNYCVAKIY